MTPFDLAVCTVIRYSRVDRCPKLEMPHVKCRIRLKCFSIDSDQKCFKDWQAAAKKCGFGRF